MNAGGQHVNKTNSKANLRLDLNERNIEKAMPPQIIQALKQSVYATKCGSLLISSDEERSAPRNTEACMRKLQILILNAIRLPGETSEMQKARVANL